MENHSIFEIWAGLVLWQKVVVGLLISIVVVLTVYGISTDKISDGDDSEIVDLSIFSKDRLKLFGIAALLFILVFIGVPYVLF